MKRMPLIPLILLAAAAAGCESPAAGPPAAPEQEVVQEYGDDQAQADRAIEQLTSLHNTIKDSLQQWRDTRASSVGPEFDGEEDSLAPEILEDCDRLELDAAALLEKPFIREHQGAAVDLEDMIRFARETRDEVRDGTQLP